MSAGASAWWRQPTVWLVIALPLGSIVASAALITVAVRTGGDDAVADSVRRLAQIQVSDLGPDVRSRQQQLSALFRVGAGYIEVLPVTGSFERHLPLQVSLHHPIFADADLNLQLTPSAHGWRASHALAGTHAWQVEVSGNDRSWRIHGRLPQGQRAAHLASAVAAP